MTRYFSSVSRDVEMLAQVIEKSENQISWQKEIVAALRQLADMLDRQQRTYVIQLPWTENVDRLELQLPPKGQR